ncbi:hypothetical protein CDV36_006839 [Fusarium kuroshium]|uniref:Major facilitator superfamily (MFS) profile domain-containing protein n=1 Tax=Fusarium kuroshium TaxID=2010991 RepID=A0A3M2S7F0_9HYPO|nr:hypothetical protein CDV36_006839 [Fusarium kuroshium]
MTRSCETPPNTQSPSDTNIVSWNGDSDANNPRNWTLGRRCTMIGLVTGVCFVSGLSSSMFAPAVPDVMKEFSSSNDVLASFVVTIFVLGLAVGPVAFAPLSELYGRLVIQHVGNIGFLAFTISCALASSLPMLIGFRLLQGMFGSVPFTNGGAVIADLIVQERRGLALTLFTCGIFLGPVVGPIAGGFLAKEEDWRWIFWLLSIMQGVLTIMCLVFLRETYPNIILERRLKRLRQETGNLQLRTKFDNGLTPRQYFNRGILRLVRMLVFSPAVLFLSIYVGLLYSYFYLLVTTITPLYQDTYGFERGVVGLSYLGLGAGFMLGQFTFASTSDKLVKRLSCKWGGEMQPEYRLPPCMIGGLFVPISFFWYGWAAQAKAHWILPIMGTSLLGFGNSLVFMSIQAYFVDAYTVYAASALGANTVVRSVMASVLPLAVPKMNESLGIGWASSLLAFLAILLLPFPYVFFRYGERLRKSPGNRRVMDG